MSCLDDCFATTTMPQPTEITQFIFESASKLVIGRIAEWDASLPWAVAVSVIAAIAIGSIGGPSEFLYWQF